MEINNEMRPFYRTYFEPTDKLRTNLVGAAKFQSVQSEHVTLGMLAKVNQLQAKNKEAEQHLAEAKIANGEALAERRKIGIIFSKLREEKKRLV